MNEIEKNNRTVSSASTQSLIQDLRQIVEQARCRVASTANAELTMMYWHIGELRQANCRISGATIARRLWNEGI